MTLYIQIYNSEQRMRGVVKRRLAKRELIGRNCVKFVHTLCLRQSGGPEVNKFKYGGRK